MTTQFVLALALVAAPAAPVPKLPDREALAKEAATQFVTALKAGDGEAMLKVADVPFCWDCVRVVKDAKELGTAFDRVPKDKDLAQLKLEVKEVFAGEKLPEKVSKSARPMASEFAKNIDFVVVMKLERDVIAVFVRVRDGKAKVCGFYD
jgi:NAD(P)H-hydrate repair Nnr-like enzyme with NAD(P)H-hydrate dehydratase domain